VIKLIAQIKVSFENASYCRIVLVQKQRSINRALDEARGENMLVIRKDNHYDYVDDFMLDSLIKSKEIIKFKCGTEWVTIGADSKRGSQQDRILDSSDRLAINDSIFVRENYRTNQ
jgi:hypothetical protein